MGGLLGTIAVFAFIIFAFGHAAIYGFVSVSF